MIHKYNTNQSIHYNQKNAFYSIPEYRNGRRHSIYLKKFIPLLEQA
jgi:hypothetical protein